MADLPSNSGFPRQAIRTGQTKSSYGGSDSPVARKTPSKWGNRPSTEETVVLLGASPVVGKSVHEHKIKEIVEDKTSITVGVGSVGKQSSSGCDNNGYGYGMYAIGFIILFIIIFLIVLAAFYFARPDCVTTKSCDSDNDDQELDFWKAGIFAFIIAIIFVIIIAALCYACSGRQ
ncbi:Hypothetical protein POVR1_LOCUS454 [uncultured virus]|nr:Hypothetical protein POVR1_LOCUS454 [uncultured virus]